MPLACDYGNATCRAAVLSVSLEMKRGGCCWVGMVRHEEGAECCHEEGWGGEETAM